MCFSPVSPSEQAVAHGRRYPNRPLSCLNIKQIPAVSLQLAINFMEMPVIVWKARHLRNSDPRLLLFCHRINSVDARRSIPPFAKDGADCRGQSAEPEALNRYT